MMSVEQDKFFALVSDVLAAYVKVLTPAQLGSWWGACRGFEFRDVERVLRAHSEGEDGGHAPRPIDVKRALRSGTRLGEGCSAQGCRYPGVFSDGTNGGGPWWCPFHNGERTGPIAEQIAHASHETPYEVARARRAERLARAADGGPAKIGPPGVVNCAHAIALRHGNKPWWPRGAQRFGYPGIKPDAEEAA